MSEHAFADGKSQPIYVAAVADDRYAQHLAVAWASLLANNEKCVPHFFVISARLSAENKNKLLKLMDDFGAEITFVSAASLAKERFGEDIHHPAYLKILLSLLLPDQIEKVLYLDCDVVVEDDLLELWNTNLDGYCLGAVEDTSRIDHLKTLIGKEGLPYFNSGVMLINLRQWRQRDIDKDLVHFVKSHHAKFLYHDQDPLNAVLYDKWLKLDVKYNFQTPLCFMEDRFCPESVPPPFIIHYSGRGKPWDYLTVQPFQENYYKYLRLTPWKNYRPKMTSQKIINLAGVAFKKYCPDGYGRVRKWLIRKALGGSVMFQRLCKHFYIEMHLNSKHK